MWALVWEGGGDCPVTKNKEHQDGRNTLGRRFLVPVSQSNGASRAGRGSSEWTASPPLRRGGAEEEPGHQGEWEEV